MKENNINLDAHSSLIIADGSIVEINGQKVLLTLVKEEKIATMKEEGSDLVGKWLRYKKEGFEVTNKWFQIESVKPACGMYLTSTNALTVHGEYAPYGDICFDLSNPLDYNPETLVGKYWNGNKIESITFPPNSTKPHFYFGQDLHVECASITPSEVTDEPPMKSLKYEDCFERVKPSLYLDNTLGLWEDRLARKDGLATERQAKQAAAMLQLMTICHDANEGWTPQNDELRLFPKWDEALNKLWFLEQYNSFLGPIYFRDKEIAQRAYEANKDIFHAYFGINE